MEDQKQAFLDARKLANVIKNSGGPDYTRFSDKDLMDLFCSAFRKIGQILKEQYEDPKQQMVDIGDSLLPLMTKNQVLNLIMDYAKENPSVSMEDARKSIFQKYKIANFKELRG